MAAPFVPLLGLVVAAAICRAWGLRPRPTRCSHGLGVAVTAASMLLMLGFNVAIGTRYPFVMRKPPRSILDHLGDWPWCLLWGAVIAAGLWALITWPWTRSQGRMSVSAFPWTSVRRSSSTRSRSRAPRAVQVFAGRVWAVCGPSRGGS